MASMQQTNGKSDMTDFMKMFGVCVAVVVFLTACGPEGGRSEAVAPAARQATAEPAPPTPAPVKQAANPDVDFAVSPATVPGCAVASPLQAKVSWQVRDTSVDQVRVEVADPGQDNWKVLSVAGRQGEVETGLWVAEGTRFRLIRSATDEQLASHDMATGPCPREGTD